MIQTFVRVREQVYSNLIGLHVMTGLPATEQATAQLAGYLCSCCAHHRRTR